MMDDFQADALSRYYAELPGKDPLPPHVLAALERLHEYILFIEINTTSRRMETRQQALNSLKVFVGSLDALSNAEYFEQREKAAKRRKTTPLTLPSKERIAS